MNIRSYLAKHSRRFLTLLIVATALPACIVVVEKDERDDDYYRRRWQLEFIVFSASTYSPHDGSIYTISFDNNDVISGRADCVDFEGRYEVGRTSTLNIDGLRSGAAVCDGESLASMYLSELQNARSYAGSTEELTIHLEGSGNFMKFRPD